jgi:phenylalanyl-tRNA synthetase beta chain
VEAAHFAPQLIARTARRHKLGSEASRRNERGVDPTLPRVAAQRVVDLLVQLGGATATPGETSVGDAGERAAIQIAEDLPTRVTGMQISHDTVAAALTAVGCSVSLTEGTVTAVPPQWRPDITDPFDLVEEVARVVGYDQVPSVLPVAPAGRGLSARQRLRRRVGHVLAAQGLTEVIAYPFIGPEQLDQLGLDLDDVRRSAIRLANPLSTVRPLLTTTLAPGLLEAGARNVGRGQGSLSLCLTAPVFLPGREPLPPAPVPGVDQRPSDDALKALDEALPAQPLHVAVLLAGDRRPAGWWGDAESASWADAIEIVRRLGQSLGVSVDVRRAEQAPWHPGRCAEVRVDGRVIGHAGELHPRVCRAVGLPVRSAYAEVDLDVLLQAAPPVATAADISTQPLAKEDVALVVDEAVPAADVAAALREGAGDLLETVRLFDVYRGNPVPAGRKSLAFALRFRAPDRTLTEQEIAVARDAAVEAAVVRLGAERRS